MYLKSLTCKGFKSFADKVVMNLEPGITAVVGPNGSGKSNISDAVLWVLGERNAKNLRGQAMEDVIFAGSSARRGTSVAEVELVLDNSDGTLPVDYAEVVIGRRMYRTGESEYLINGTIARRMDVLDILHDSGLGAGTHSIISQGSIDSVLASKPEDRRNLIEEAAGVLKHKERLHKSARKLERMESHVERVSDVVSEVARQLGPLERKAKRAKKYTELAGELAEAKLLLAVDDLREVQAKYSELESGEAALEQTLGEKRSAFEAMDAEMQELQRKMREQVEDTGELSRRQRASASAADRLGSAIAVARDRRRSALSRANEIEVEAVALKASVDRLEGALAEAKLKLEKSASAKAASDASVERLSAQLAEADAARSGLAAERAKLEDDIARMDRELVRTREEKALAQESLTQGMARLKVLEGHAAELELLVERSSADAKSAEADAQALEEALAAMEAQEREARSLVATCSRAREAAQLAYDEANAAEQSIKAQLAALDAIEKKRASADDARAWVERNAADLLLDARPLSHVVKAEKGYEGLVELLLGHDVDALALQSVAEVKRAIGAVEGAQVAGEVTFVAVQDAARTQPSADGPDAASALPGRPLMDALTYAPEYADAIDALLGDVIVCDTAQDAIDAHEGDRGAHRFVVSDGTIVWPSGKVAFGLAVLDEDQGTLARVRQIEELRRSLTNAAQITESAQSEAASAEKALVAAQNDSLKLSERLAEMRGNVQSSRNLAKQALDKLASHTRELDEAGKRRSEAENLIAEARPDAARLDEKLSELQASHEAARQAQEDIASRLAPMTQLSERLRTELQQSQLEAATISERAVYDERMVTSHASELAGAVSAIGASRVAMHEKSVAAERLGSLLSVMDLIEASARKLAGQLEAEAAERQNSTSGMHAASEELRQRSHAAQAELDDVNERLSAARVEKARLEMQVRAGVTEIVEGCAMPLEQALQLPKLEGRLALEERANELAGKIARLGTINPDAAEEYDELKERYDYLAGQLADLSHAARSLTKINRMIESRMKDDFVNTYEDINANFQEVFAMLFPDGKANLSLVDPEDLENTGVEVNAQPAGKRISKMSLMSGGEKSLTALALLFALYRTRPTPFYILDEVEAALDDSNLRRLVSFINAMRDATQLIMITHQRRTMEMADVLFGVSMGADGVTKVISQKLEAALRHAE